ncbi:hypothetical protein C8Q77DRAFT_837556 [Trametes polyzona]|nr:hypothetical protein C8Q77DRAFT_837556 [Trametes polyzona]
MLARPAYKSVATLVLCQVPRPQTAYTLGLHPLPSHICTRAYSTPARRLTTMSAAIVLPNLPNWVQQRLKAVYGANSMDAFNDAFDLFVSEHAKITVNGKAMSRAQYKALLQGETSADTSEGISGIVTVSSVVSVPEDGNINTIGTGSVGISFKAEVFGRFFVFGARQSSTISSSLNVVYVFPSFQYFLTRALMTSLP